MNATQADSVGFISIDPAVDIIRVDQPVDMDVDGGETKAEESENIPEGEQKAKENAEDIADNQGLGEDVLDFSPNTSLF